MKGNWSFLVISLGLIALFFWSLSLGGGPEVTGRTGAEVRVSEVANPAEDGVDLPQGFRQLLDRDAILPIYEPTFVPAGQADWPDNVLVVGVEINGDARAYPVGHLNRREMVIDTIGDIPVLVTW